MHGLRRRCDCWRLCSIVPRSAVRGRPRGLAGRSSIPAGAASRGTRCHHSRGSVGCSAWERRRCTIRSRSNLDRGEFQELLGDLHGIRGRALAEVVADAPEQERVGPGEIESDPADENVILAGGIGGQRVYAWSSGRPRPSRPGRRPRGPAPPRPRPDAPSRRGSTRCARRRPERERKSG